jgi:predicted glycosyltransferase involved in capsule biosynthesis
MGKIRQSIIISYRESDEDRKINLQKLLPFLSKLLDYETEIVLVEQDITSKINWIDHNDQIKHIFIYNNKIFNKGLGYNVGVNNAKSDHLIFNDIDVFLKIDSYRSSLKLLNKADVVNPYDTLYYLDKNQSKTFISNNYDFNIIETLGQKITPDVISGGIFMMKKEKFLSIGGFDENCYGYGYEDDIFDIKIKKLELNIIKAKDVAIHIHHKINKVFYNKYYTQQDINKKLFEEYQRMSTDQLKEKIKNI